MWMQVIHTCDYIDKMSQRANYAGKSGSFGTILSCVSSGTIRLPEHKYSISWNSNLWDWSISCTWNGSQKLVLQISIIVTWRYMFHVLIYGKPEQSFGIVIDIPATGRRNSRFYIGSITVLWNGHNLCISQLHGSIAVVIAVYGLHWNWRSMTHCQRHPSEPNYWKKNWHDWLRHRPK